MTTFDKICATGACLLAVALIVLGVIGLFAGCRAQFTLPPILGILPAFIGWGILRAITVAWNAPPHRESLSPSDHQQPDGEGIDWK